MKIKNVLIIYKKSAYELMRWHKDRQIKFKSNAVFQKEKEYFLKSHQAHYAALRHIETVLKEKGLVYKKVFRDRNVQYRRYDLVITVGGDGTFLRTTPHLTRQHILGVNSAPEFSVGRLCHANQQTFKRVLECVIAGSFKTVLFQRLELYFPSTKKKYLALNDCLIAHQNPAEMSRYIMRVGGKVEKQRSSGVWISTAIGSTGAIRSAGGKALKESEKKFQYRPRELYSRKSTPYKLKGGVLSSRSEIDVTSLMHHGYVYIDGSRMKVRFPYGAQLRIKLSSKPIKTIVT